MQDTERFIQEELDKQPHHIFAKEDDYREALRRAIKFGQEVGLRQALERVKYEMEQNCKNALEEHTPFYRGQGTRTVAAISDLIEKNV